MHRIAWFAVSLVVAAFLATTASAGASPVDALLPPRETPYGKVKSGALRMHIVVVSIPCYGHYMPLKSVAEELLLRGHEVSIFVEPHQQKSWCHTAAATEGQSFNCIPIKRSHTFEDALFVNMSAHDEVGESFTELFEEMFKHHERQLPVYIAEAEELNKTKPISLILTDLSTLAGFGLAAKLDVPYVSMFPLSMHMPLGSSTYLPSLGTVFPRHLSYGQRLINWFIKVAVALGGNSMVKRLDDVRVANGVRPFKTPSEVAGMKSLIFNPTVWGLDIPQPLCPNIIGLGVLTPLHDHEPMEQELSTFLDTTCKDRGAVYVNFGTLALLGDRTFEQLWEGLRRVDYCIVWKIREEHRMEAIKAALDADPQLKARLYVTTRFANPVAIMRHQNTRSFVTHCGDTSVLEALDSALPVVGIPIFADQGDVCMRVNESGFGRYVGHKNKFTAEDLAASLNEVNAGVARTEANIKSSSHPFLSRARQLREVSRSRGGAARGASMLEEHYTQGLLASDAEAAAWGGFQDTELLQCHVLTAPYVEEQATTWRLLRLDVLLMDCFGIIVALLLGKKLLCCCCCCCGRGRKRGGSEEQDADGSKESAPVKRTATPSGTKRRKPRKED